MTEMPPERTSEASSQPPDDALVDKLFDSLKNIIEKGEAPGTVRLKSGLESVEKFNEIRNEFVELGRGDLSKFDNLLSKVADKFIWEAQQQH